MHRLFALVLALALLTLRTGQAAAAPDTARHERLVLPNGIRVLLVSDPGFNVSAASLVVGVGSLADPPARQGLAHFHPRRLGTGVAGAQGQAAVLLNQVLQFAERGVGGQALPHLLQ
ncbi:MAG: insulinase family protein, partial [Bryobacterales bacterium]|nr:insulinase family protein [Bryobacterales bacterium]